MSNTTFGSEDDERMRKENAKWKEEQKARTQKEQDEHLQGLLRQARLKFKGGYVNDPATGELRPVPPDRFEAMYLLHRYYLESEHVFTFSDTDEICIYHDGIYRTDGKSILSQKLYTLGLNGQIKNHLVEEFNSHFSRSTTVRREDIKLEIEKVAVQNGIIDMNRGAFEEFNPKYILFNKLPVKYDPEAKCPTIQKFMQDAIDEKYHAAILEFIGSCLVKDYRTQTALMLHGGGGNGKSTMLGIIKALLGAENCSAVPIQALNSEERNSVARLHNKLANICADLPKSSIKDAAYFKELTSGNDMVHAERKYFQPFEFVNYAKLIFSSNDIPYTHDDSNAFFRRWMIVPFSRKFQGKEADENILSKLTTPQELSGLLNLCIEAWQRWTTNKQFTGADTAEEVEAQYRRRSDPVVAFFQDDCDEGEDLSISKEELYAAYLDWAKRMAQPPKVEDWFWRKWRKHLPEFQIMMGNRASGRKRILVGISLKLKQESGATGTTTPILYADEGKKKGEQCTLGYATRATIPVEETISTMVSDGTIPVWRGLREELLPFIRAYDTGDGVSWDALAALAVKTGNRPGELDPLLEALQAQGAIFKPRPGYWKALS